MGRISTLLAIVGAICAAASVYLIRLAYDTDFNVDAGGQAVANMALMHVQGMYMVQGIGAAICAVVLLAAAGIAATIERP